MTAPAPARRAAAAAPIADDLSSLDLGTAGQARLLDRAQRLREQRRLGHLPRPLADRTVALLFEKPSLRTRVTFDEGITRLGGHVIYLGPEEVGIGRRETATDVGRNLSRWVDAIVSRTFAHGTLVELAESASVPVVNALSDREPGGRVSLGEPLPAAAKAVENRVDVAGVPRRARRNGARGGHARRRQGQHVTSRTAPERRGPGTRRA